MSLVACEDPNSDDPGTKPEPEGLTFEITIDETQVTKSTMTFTIVPSDLNAEYLCMVYDVVGADDFTKDEYLVATLYQELTAEAASKGLTFAEYMPQIVDKGIIEDGVFSGLAADTEYYLLVFGVDAANGYKESTPVQKVKFKTQGIEMVECTFDVTPVVNFNTVEFTVIPSDKETLWHLFTVTKAQWEYYTQDPEGYMMSPETFYIQYFNSEIEQYRGAGYSDEQIIEAVLLTGDKLLKASGLTANTDYVYVIAGLTMDAEGVFVSTDIFTGGYTTGDPAKSDMTFNITVTDIEAMRAALKITPSKDREAYCWMCGAYDGKATADELMNKLVEQYGSWMNGGAMLYTGVQDYTGGPGSPFKYKLDAPDTEYYVIAFGYSGGITTAPEMVTFRTLPGADPMEVEFSMTASNTTPYSTDIAIIVSDDTVYYSGSAIAPEDYNEEELIEAFNADFDYILEQSQMMDPNVTVASVLRTYYWSGSQNLAATGLLPETELMGFIVALDTKTGHVARVITFPNLATTPAAGSVTPSIELVGYYSGDEENGTVFGKASATKGKAITVVKYDNFEGARTLFTTMVGDDCTNATAFPDTELWALARGYWNSCKISTPYSFYVADWEYVQTALVYATDSKNGMPGGIGRLYTLPTAEEKGEIADLKELYDSLVAAEKAVALPASLVVGEPRTSAAPTITNVTAPKAEVVAEVATEAEFVESEVAIPSMLQLDYIRPFYLRK